MKYAVAVSLLVALTTPVLAQDNIVYLDCSVKLVNSRDETTKIGEEAKFLFTINTTTQTGQMPSWTEFAFTSTHADPNYRLGLSPTAVAFGDPTDDKTRYFFSISRVDLTAYFKLYNNSSTEKTYEGKCQKTAPHKTPEVVF